MPRYQRDEAWFVIEVDDDRLIVRDADGERNDRFDTSDDAEAAYDEYVLDALQQGYKLGEEPVDAKRALEQTILGIPDAVEAHLVYADILMTEGDPRGELIALHAGLFQKPDDAELKARARQFRKEHAEHFYGDFEELLELGLELDWKLGFVRSAKLDMPPRDWDEEEGSGSTEEIAELLATFLAHPSARFLRSLTIHDVWNELEDEGVLDPIVKAIAETTGPWDALHTLEISPGEEGYVTSEINNGDLLFQHLPALRILRLHASVLMLRDLGEPRLHQLQLEEGVSQVVLRALGEAQWPELGELDLSFARGTARPEQVRALLDRADRFPRLRTLRLRRANFTDEIVDHLLATPSLARRIEVLDLSGGSMTDAAAQTLVACARELPHLKRLDVSHNQLSSQAHRDLRNLSCKVIFGEQTPLQNDRFDGIQE